MVIRGALKASQLLIQGSAFVGHADEFLARRTLQQVGCIFDDDPMGYLGGNQRIAQVATGITLTNADNYKLFICSGADCLFVLPTIQPGLVFETLATDDFETKFTGTALIFVGNDEVANAVGFATDGESIGGRMTIESHYLKGVLKWVPNFKSTEFSTDNYLATTIAT